jgi:integrase
MAVLKTKAGTWEVRYRVQKRQIQKTFQNYRAAVSFDEKTKTQLREGDYVAPSALTVKEIVEKWLEARKPRWATQTYNGHNTHLTKYIEPRLGQTKATSLRGTDVETAGAEWENSVAPLTVNKIFGTLAAAYKFANKKLGVKKNPMMDVERLAHRASPDELEAEALGAIPDRGEDTPDEKPNTLRAIRPDEVYSALELKKIIEASAPGLERVLFMTGILLGLRHGELNGLRWSIVNLKTGTLFVNRSLTELKGGPVLEKPKTRNAYRHLKMAPELVSELRRWKLKCPPSHNGFVFADELGPMNRKANNRILKACCENAGVRVLCMNNLRHSFASQHLIAGTPVLQVSAMMGHSDPSVTLKVYSRWAANEESSAEAALAGRILGADEPEAETGSE